YSQTEGKNYNGYTTGNYCVRFDSIGTAAQVGGEALPGGVVTYGGGGVGATLDDGSAYISPDRSPVATLAGFRDYLGLPAAGYNVNGNAPWWIPVTDQNAATGPTLADSPTVAFNNQAVGTWVKISLNSTGAQF